MCHFTAAEADGDLDPVALAKEFDGIAHFHIEIVDINAGRHADFLDFHHMLVFAGLFFPLGLLKAIFSIVHQLADGRDGIGGDLDQIQALLVSHVQRFLGGHDAQLFPFSRNQPDLLVTDVFIDLMTCVTDKKAPSNDEMSEYPKGTPLTTQRHTEGRW